MTNKFSQDYEKFISMIKERENFVFARYADGERMILQNQNILQGTQAHDVDRWTYKNNLIFADDLLKTCSHRERNYYYAVSCECCDPYGKIFYRSLMQNHNLTFSNLFINKNYQKFIDFVSNDLDRETVVLCNKEAKIDSFPFKVLELYKIEDDCINWYETKKESILEDVKKLAEKYQNTLFFISSGPLSEILIDKMFQTNPDNSYIDVGSSLDIYVHSRITRPYQIDGNPYRLKECY